MSRSPYAAARIMKRCRLALWPRTQITLALDASALGMRFVVLAVSVVYCRCAMPVAWIVLPAGTPRAWRPEWLRLLRRLHRVILRNRLPSWTLGGAQPPRQLGQLTCIAPLVVIPG